MLYLSDAPVPRIPVEKTNKTKVSFAFLEPNLLRQREAFVATKATGLLQASPALLEVVLLRWKW